MFGDDGQPYLARILVTCWAADGRPTKVGMTGKVPEEMVADSWLAVTRACTSQTGKDPINAAVIAFIQVNEDEPILKLGHRLRSGSWRRVP